MSLGVCVCVCLYKILVPPPNNVQTSYLIDTKILTTYSILPELSKAINIVS